MSRKKNIANYYKQQESQQKKENSKKRTGIILNVIIVVLLITILITGIVIYNRRPVKVAIQVKDYGTIVIEVYPNIAPITVKNFLNYVEDGFYDGLIFHRVFEDFMIQGGDPTGSGYGDPSLEKIKGEFSENGVTNNLKFDRGVVGMARGNDPDSASSQFFIMHKKTESLDGKYAAFGKVIEGIEVVDAIAAVETNEDDRPLTAIHIEKIYLV